MGFFGGGGRDDGGDHGELGPPPDPFRLPHRGDRYGGGNGQRRMLGFLAAAMVLFFTADALKTIYVDGLWFASISFSSVFRTELNARVALFFAGAAVALVVLGVNVGLARRLAPREPEESFLEDIDPASIRRVVTAIAIALTAFVALIFGASAGGAWDIALPAMNAVQFGLNDPQFGRDVSFYLFTLPALHTLQGWVLALIVVSTLAAAAVYVLSYSLQRFVLNVTTGMRIHLSILVGLALVVLAFGTWLSVFDLASHEAGVVAGATYADVHARIPMLYVLALLTLLVGVATALNGVLGTSFRVPAFGLGLIAFAAVVGTGIYPAAVESLQVQPNELQTESEYIARNIRMTRIAYGMDHVQETNFPARPALTAAQIDANPVTTDNIRLWDPTPLRDTFNQIQSIRPFYTFVDVDVDRYPIDGKTQQTMLSVRELDVARSGAANWTRQVLQLTHGFGVVASPVNAARDEGLPVLLVSDIPPTGDAIPVTEAGSRIYFGERTDHYVVVRTNVPEFDYPVGDSSKDTRFEPDRGIPLASAWQRLALAWELGDTNLMISGQLGADSRVLMHRTLTDRIHKVAPFLQLDPDPYAVVLNGRVMWVQDAFTSSPNFPYAQHRNGINYIRNSVKVLVDAGTGDMTFFLMTPDDPIIATWAKIFPNLFTPLSAMPLGLTNHLRYPEAMFKMQADIYQRYHITDPRAFFVGEDTWNIPVQPAQQSGRPLEPYYVTMKLPGEANEEFVLVMPFTPRNKENTVAWLAARSDGQFYGALRAYRFPTDTLVFGPVQIEARIDQNPGISQQMTLWNQSGSHVIRGNLLMIPIADSFLFVEPIYLQAENSPLPELKRVIVANGNEIAMEPSFVDALDVVLGRKDSTLPGGPSGGLQAPRPPAGSATPRPTAAAGSTPAAGATPSPQDLRTLIDQARQASGNAQGELDRLKGLLDQIESQSSR
jgi:uncharacterized membrane protein (UPF0182 family)